MAFIGIVLGLLLFASLIYFVVYNSRKVGKSKNITWYSFYKLCKIRSLNYKESILLEKVITIGSIVNPLTAFSNIKLLDSILHGYIDLIRNSAVNEAQREIIISKLMSIRRKFEFSLPKYKKGIKNTYSLRNDQRMRLALPEVGYFFSNVIDRQASYIICSFPEGHNSDRINWKGKTLNAYFWRENDAGYSFNSEVVGELKGKDLRAIFIEHSEKLSRNQKRRFLRVSCGVPVFIRPIEISIENSQKVAKVSSTIKFNGVITNISGNGMAIEVSSDIKGGTFVRLEFSFEGKEKLRLIAKVKGTKTQKKENGYYRINLQFAKIDIKTRNNILLYVYKFHSKPIN